MTEQEFIQFVKEECKYYGVKFKLGKGKYVKMNDSTFCSGYFDAENRVLSCGLKNDYYFGILVHEYCHMRQWIEKAPSWIRADKENSYVMWEKLGSGKKVKNMDHHFNVIRDLELDNEKRAVALIKKLKLPINIKDYIKKANCYIMFYNYMKITGKWYKVANNPCKNKRLIAAMPHKFSLNYNILPKRLEKIYIEEGI